MLLAQVDPYPQNERRGLRVRVTPHQSPMFSTRVFRIRNKTGVRPRVPPKTKSTVFVVVDDASLLRAMERLLDSLSYEVLLFRSAEAFIAQDAPAADACLLLDIFLPGMSGVDLYASLAASGRPIPTVLITARDEESTRNLVAEVGATAILCKPFDEDVLPEAIARAFTNAESV